MRQLHLNWCLGEAAWRQTTPKSHLPERTPATPPPQAERLAASAVRRRDAEPGPPLTGCGRGCGSWPGLDFFGSEGPPGQEKDFGNLADGDVRPLADPEGPPRRCPPPEKGTKGAGVGSSETHAAWTSTQPAPEVPAWSWRLTSPWLHPGALSRSGGLPAACSADGGAIGLPGLLLRGTPGSCSPTESRCLMANLRGGQAERVTLHTLALSRSPRPRLPRLTHCCPLPPRKLQRTGDMGPRPRSCVSRCAPFEAPT